MDKKLYDRMGRPILVGDVVKVFHFTGKRRKKHYLYKRIVGKNNINGVDYLVLDHLGSEPSTYNLKLDDRILEDYEIVQGSDDRGVSFEDRDRVKRVFK